MANSRKPDYKWIVLIIVSAVYFLAQGTRLIYAAVLPQIKTDFSALGVSDTLLGLVGSSFTLVFGLVMPFAGIIADMYSRKWIVAVGCLMFSVGIFCSGLASGLGMLFMSYGVLNAVGQALLPPCNSSLISQFHAETRGAAFSIYQVAIYLGIIICSVCSGYLASLGEGGWRKAFMIFGSVGLLMVVVIVVFLRNSPQPGGTNDSSRPTVREALRSFVSKPSALILMGALGCYFFTTYGFKNWVPMFMIRTFPDMPTTEAVFHAVFWFYIGAFVGVTIAGRASDKLKRRRKAVRLEVELVGMLLCIPFILLMAFSHNLATMIVAVSLFGFATGVYDSNLYAALLEVINPRYRAVATGIFGCGGCIVGALGPAVMGWMNDAFSIRVSFAALSVFALLGACLLEFARRRTFNRDMI